MQQQMLIYISIKLVLIKLVFYCIEKLKRWLLTIRFSISTLRSETRNSPHRIRTSSHNLRRLGINNSTRLRHVRNFRLALEGAQNQTFSGLHLIGWLSGLSVLIQVLRRGRHSPDWIRTSWSVLQFRKYFNCFGDIHSWNSANCKRTVLKSTWVSKKENHSYLS